MCIFQIEHRRANQYFNTSLDWAASPDIAVLHNISLVLSRRSKKFIIISRGGLALRSAQALFHYIYVRRRTFPVLHPSYPIIMQHV